MFTSPFWTLKGTNTSARWWTKRFRLYRASNSSSVTKWVQTNSFLSLCEYFAASCLPSDFALIRKAFPVSGFQKVTPPVCTPYVSFTSLKYLHQTIPPLSRIPPFQTAKSAKFHWGKAISSSFARLLYFRLIFQMILSPFRSKLHDSFTLIEWSP